MTSQEKLNEIINNIIGDCEHHSVITMHTKENVESFMKRSIKTNIREYVDFLMKEPIGVIRDAVALESMLQLDRKLSESDYELYGYGELCANIKVIGNKIINENNL